MRIVAWNMDHWRRSQDLRDRAWRYLSEELHPDVALLQESVPRGDTDKVVFREGGILDERKQPLRAPRHRDHRDRRIVTTQIGAS